MLQTQAVASSGPGQLSPDTTRMHSPPRPTATSGMDECSRVLLDQQSADLEATMNVLAAAQSHWDNMTPCDTSARDEAARIRQRPTALHRLDAGAPTPASSPNNLNSYAACMAEGTPMSDNTQRLAAISHYCQRLLKHCRQRKEFA
jgi:hypothetical protein